MPNLNFIDGDALPLNGLEKALRYVYLNAVPLHDVLHTQLHAAQLDRFFEDFPDERDVFCRICESHLLERPVTNHIFFPEKSDIVLSRHPRYCPATPHSLSFFKLQYVFRGPAVQTVRNRQIALSPGDLFILAPDTPHTLFTNNDEAIIMNIMIRKDTFREKFISILNTNDIVADFFSNVLYSNSYYPYIYCHTYDNRQLREIVVRLYDVQCGNGRYKNRMLINKLEELMICLLETYENDIIVDTLVDDREKSILPILKYIQNNFREVTLSGLASYFGYNESYLSRLIKNYTRKSYSEILGTTRLHHAATMLATTTMSIDAIRADSGYNNNTYFYKQFVKKYGMTPANYRISKQGV